MRQIDTLAQELRHALRGFRRAPQFTLVAVVAVALGVGPTTAVFSVVDHILFRSLPYPHDDRLVSFGMTAPIATQEFMMGYDYLDWHETNTPFQSLGAWTGESDCDYTGEKPEGLRCAQADAYLLPTLGIQPWLGRNFTASEDQPHGARVAIISHGLWQSRFAGDPHVIGKALPLDGQMPTIVGVLPPQFELPTLARADVLVPMALDRAARATRRRAILLLTVGRLKSGVTPEQAAVGLQPLFQRALKLGVSPEFWKDIKLRVRPLRDRQVLDARLASWVLLGAVLGVLAIACANVAGLLLARAVTRQREYTVRAALGAGRGRLAGQALIESLLIGLAGGAMGCILAGLLLRLFVAIAPEGIPRLNQATLDFRVLLFMLAVSVGSGVLFGLAPALRGPQAEMLRAWKTTGGRYPLFRRTLVTAQISVSMILLAGAGLLLRSLWNIENQPLGMHSEGVVTATVSLSRNAYSDQQRRLAFFDELEARLRRIPGVRGACELGSSRGQTRGADALCRAQRAGQTRAAGGNGRGGDVATGDSGLLCGTKHSDPSRTWISGGGSRPRSPRDDHQRHSGPPLVPR
jgi:predicted permease